MREWSLKGLLLADTTVSPENPGRCEFAKFMANHILRDVNRHEGLAVVNCKVMADEVWSDHRLAAPSFDGLAVGSGVGNSIDLRKKLLVDEWAFF